MVYGKDVFHTSDIPSDCKYADWHEYYLDIYNIRSHTYRRFYFRVTIFKK